MFPHKMVFEIFCPQLVGAHFDLPLLINYFFNQKSDYYIGVCQQACGWKGGWKGGHKQFLLCTSPTFLKGF